MCLLPSVLFSVCANGVAWIASATGLSRLSSVSLAISSISINAISIT